MSSECDILVFTAAFGLGHYSVAKAVQYQIQEINCSCKVEIIDLLDVFHPKAKWLFTAIYRKLTRHYPNLYNFFYKLKKNIKDNFIDGIIYLIYINKIKNFILEKKPKIIISTFPLCSGFVSRVKQRFKLNVKMITVVTDVVDSWEWIHECTDMYFVPSSMIKTKLISKGVNESRIKVTGVPVRNEFFAVNSKEKDLKQVLIIDSEMDKLGMGPEFLERLSKMHHVKTVIVTGSNKKLYEVLSQKNTYENVEIVGFTNEIAKIMDKSDLVVTKPGGVTLFEIINKGIPMVLKNSNVGQEKENVEFIQKFGIGVLVDDGDNLLRVIEEILNDEEKLDKIMNNIRLLQRDIEPGKVGQYSLELL